MRVGNDPVGLDTGRAGADEAGIAQMRQGLAAWRATGTELIRPYFLGLLAEGYRKGGQVAAGLGAIDEALALVQQNKETFCEAELYRLKGVAAVPVCRA